MSKHAFQVTLRRRGDADPIDGGTVTFTGEDYATFGEGDALPRLMPGGGGPEQIDLGTPGFLRWRGILLPTSDFEQLEVRLTSKSVD